MEKLLIPERDVWEGLNWPASSNFPRLLEKVHEALARQTGFFYRDKDILLLKEVNFIGGIGLYQRPKSMIVSMHRFNERGYGHPLSSTDAQVLDYQIFFMEDGLYFEAMLPAR